MTHRLLTTVAFAAAACSGAALAQTIELSSESLGTVQVKPGSVATPSSTAPAPRGRAARSNGTGVDLGIRRNPDGTLFDALDPDQNPAAAPKGTLGAGAATTTGTAGAASAAGTAARTLNNPTLQPGAGPRSAASRSVGGELGSGTGGELGTGTGGPLPATGAATPGTAASSGASTSNVETGPAGHAGGSAAMGGGAASAGGAGGGR